ncbi:MAG TPA: DUF6265 family protein [Flavobacteriales bacterium]|nr:DUF6265 family protein [Flavobacteriales bacterium]
MRKIVVILACCSVIASCGGEKEREKSIKKDTTEITSIPDFPNNLNAFPWVLGSWANISPEMSMYESWEMKSDTVWIGKSFGIQKSDTILKESIRIEHRGKNAFYIPTVNDQNDGKPVEFKLTRLSDIEIVFENPKHDFPTKITYRYINQDSLIAEISGIRNGKEAKEVFPYKRIK